MAEFQAKLDTRWLSKIADFIEENAKSMGCNEPQTLFDLKLAVDEASTNIMRYGKNRKNTFTIRIEKQGPKTIQVEIIDHGKPYDFDHVTLPAPHLSIDEKLKHGFGIGLIKAVTENASYTAYPDKNILAFTKTLTKTEGTLSPKGDLNGNSRKKDK